MQRRLEENQHLGVCVIFIQITTNMHMQLCDCTRGNPFQVKAAVPGLYKGCMRSDVYAL